MATSGFEKADKAKAEAKDATELEISAGGLASAGNSRSIAATSAGKFRWRRRSDQVGAGIAANYAESKVNKGDGLADHGRELSRQSSLRSVLGRLVRRVRRRVRAP